MANYINRENKETIWQKTMQEVDQVIYTYCKGVDDGIKETVCALLVHGFEIRTACEGHLDYGFPYPVVEICTLPPSGFDDAKGIKRKLRDVELEWNFKNLKQQKRMLDLLEEFYRERKSPLEAHLIFSYIGYGGFRLENFGAYTMDLYSLEEKKKKLELYREEMKAFAEFLKNKFFSEE